MRWDNFTVMSQEAIQRAQSRAAELGNPEVRPEHMLWSFLGQEDNIVNGLLNKLGAPAARIRADVEAALSRVPKVQGGGEAALSPALRDVLALAAKEAETLKDEYVSTEHLFLAMLKDEGSGVARILRAIRRHGGRRPQGAGLGPRLPAGHRPGAGGQVPGPREIRPRPHGAGPPGQARPGHRPRGRDPARHPGPVAADQEQPRPHRRGGRGQDGRRRRPGPAHRQRRRAPVPEEQAAPGPRHRRARRRDQVPRRVRGPAQGDPEGDPGVGRRHHPLHRRAPHDHRRRRGRGRRSTPRTCSSRPWPGASSGASGRRRSTSTESTSRRTRPSSAASSRSTSASRRSRRRSRSSAGSRRSTRSTTASGSRTRPWSPRRRSPTATSPSRYLPDKAIDLIDEAASRIRIQIDSLPEEIDELDRRKLQLEIERQALKKEKDPASAERLEKIEAELADIKERSRRPAGPVAERKRRSSRAHEPAQGAGR